MKITHCKKKFISILYLIITSCLIRTCNSQKERFSRWDLDTDFELMKNFEGDTVPPERSVKDYEDERDNFYMQFRKRRPGHNEAVISDFSATKPEKAIRTLPFFQTGPPSCSCEEKHDIYDLGLMYYPRHVSVAICEPSKCQGGPFRCHPKKYKVKVLKRKQLDEKDLETNSAALPRHLKDLFVEETINITVACECRL